MPAISGRVCGTNDAAAHLGCATTPPWWGRAPGSCCVAPEFGRSCYVAVPETVVNSSADSCYVAQSSANNRFCFLKTVCKVLRFSSNAPSPFAVFYGQNKKTRRLKCEQHTCAINPSSPGRPQAVPSTHPRHRCTCVLPLPPNSAPPSSTRTHPIICSQADCGVCCAVPTHQTLARA